MRTQPSDCPSLIVAGLVLAAGISERMGVENKLLLPFKGEPMLSHSLRAVQKSGVDPVCMVTGYERERVAPLGAAFNVEEVFNAEYAQGQDKTLAVGLAALQALGCSVLVVLGDQPLVSAKLISSLIQAHRDDGGTRATVPVFEGRWGTPRILPSALACQAARAKGRLSLRETLKAQPENVQFVVTNDSSVVLDVDTPAQYRSLDQRLE